ncbi:MAG TPA: bifunctional methylenetetrahydrofolate dehydrogenase/methenyltetrahydrofolate cyclohydrolase [Elusimicrobia bacterium]|jgi:methylenetetrahydrofolate dehydrogenase (NADP+)/methenyltetrahydrofolate cyclohydrolase|nr:bifunctional methylenetetrahydrofolate dehydrogenase/methenyltetrahydrofolate cyclohydrolase [Elusimicrobiota bacterium]
MADIIEGKTLSQSILADVASRAAAAAALLGRKPSLAIVNYYADSPSAIYVKRKIAACDKAGIETRLIMPEESKGRDHFFGLLRELGADPGVDAIMVERPLPAGFDVPEAWELLDPAKDPDALSTLNMGRLFLAKTWKEIEGGGFFVPCTALAVVKIMKRAGIDPAGKEIAVVGRSAIVGRPAAHMLTCLDATVTLCHSRTKDIAAVLKRAEIVVTAIGKALWLKPDMINPGSVVIDVGTNIGPDGKMCGDADFAALAGTAGRITPVPGGVGPVTLACLLAAAVTAAERRAKEKK